MHREVVRGRGADGGLFCGEDVSQCVAPIYKDGMLVVRLQGDQVELDFPGHGVYRRGLYMPSTESVVISYGVALQLCPDSTTGG